VRGVLIIAVLASAGIARGDALHMECSGAGRPIVVLEAGAGRSSSDWAKVVPAVAATNRVCVYDRAGLGRSAKARKRTSALDDAHALESLLRTHGEAGPFVLVGHSYGRIVVRVFAQQFPGEIAGLVLVDSSVEDFNEQRAALLHETLEPFPTRPIDWNAASIRFAN